MSFTLIQGCHVRNDSSVFTDNVGFTTLSEDANRFVGGVQFSYPITQDSYGRALDLPNFRSLTLNTTISNVDGDSGEIHISVINTLNPDPFSDSYLRISSSKSSRTHVISVLFRYVCYDKLL
jgi:hypothetical protein